MTPSIGILIGKIVEHARQGTLLSRVSQALRRPGAADPDHYHGDVARNYLSKRLQQKAWHIEQRIVQELLHECPRGSTVLDVPFGTGRFVQMCHARDMHVCGIDISQDMLDVARRELGASYDRCDVRLGDATALPWPSDTFDVVICFRFFGLISFKMAHDVLDEIRRVCRGRAIIRVPVVADPAARSGTLKPHESVQGQLLESELAAMFTQHGLAVSDVRFIEQRDGVDFKVYVLNHVTAPDT